MFLYQRLNKFLWAFMLNQSSMDNISYLFNYSSYLVGICGFYWNSTKQFICHHLSWVSGYVPRIWCYLMLASSQSNSEHSARKCGDSLKKMAYFLPSKNLSVLTLVQIGSLSGYDTWSISSWVSLYLSFPSCKRKLIISLSWKTVENSEVMFRVWTY